MSTQAQNMAPGVYLEFETIAKPRSAFETAVPVFIGGISPHGSSLPLFGDAGPAPAVVSMDAAQWSILEASMGTAWAEGYLGFVVRGFFENGGRRCLVLSLPRGEGRVRRALALLDAHEDFDLLCAPFLTPTWPPDLDLVHVQEQALLIRFCEDHPGCVALLDAKMNVDELKSKRTLPAPFRSPNAALYTPWIKVPGACLQCKATGIHAGTTCDECWGTGHGAIPPCGHVAGLIARTDMQSGIHKPPANEVLQGVLDLELQLNDSHLAKLNALGINALRAFPARGIRVWGARTLAPDDPDFAFLSVRRVFLSIARWLTRFMGDVVFEPNDFRLWSRITRDVGAFLERLFRRGMLMGASPAEAFYVKCDAETNTSMLRDAGKVMTEVGVAIAKPAEFLVIRLLSGASDVSVSSTSVKPPATSSATSTSTLANTSTF